MTELLTKPPGSFGKDDMKPGMAFFEGTGPVGARCGGCIHRGYYRQAERGSHSYRVNKCAQFKRMGGGRHGADISPDYRACKYFEQKHK